MECVHLGSGNGHGAIIGLDDKLDDDSCRGRGLPKAGLDVAGSELFSVTLDDVADKMPFEVGVSKRLGLAFCCAPVFGGGLLLDASEHYQGK